jgi:molecular chaperone DnaK
VNATKGGDVSSMRRAKDEFNDALQRVGQVVYQEAGAGSASGQAGQAGPQSGQQGGDDDVIDADYREVR